MTSHPEPDPPVVRPRRQIRLPAHLADYQVAGSGYVKRVLPTAGLNEAEMQDALTMPENASRSSSPRSQPSYRDELILQDEWRETFEDMPREKKELHFQAQQLSDIKFMWREMKRDSDELHSHILPEILSALQGLKAENAELKQEIQQIATGRETPCQSVTPIPAPCINVPTPMHSQRSLVTQRKHAAYSDDISQSRPVQSEQLTKQMKDLTLSPRSEQMGANVIHRAPPQRSYAYSQQHVEAMHYHDETPQSRYGLYPGEREFHLPQ